MKRRLVIALVVAALLTTGAAVALLLDRGAPRPERATPTLVPGDFESDPGALGWRLSPGDGDVGLTSARARSGASSLRVSGTGAAPLAAATYPHVTASAGRSYAAGAFALVSAGGGRLSLTFHGADGRLLDAVEATTGPTTGLWSRVAVTGTAPAGTTSASLMLSAEGGRASDVDWDDLVAVDTTVPNGGFEQSRAAGDPEGGCPTSWRCASADGTTAERSTAVHRSGSASLLLTDRSTSTAATARTSLVQVAPSVGVRVAAWVRTGSGGAPTPSLTVRWFDAAMEPLGTPGAPVRAPDGAGWQQLLTTATAPDTAAWASVELSTSEAGTGTAAWDDVSLQPSPSAPATTWQPSPVARLDGFTTTTTSRVVDVAGRPKLVTVVSGAPATLQLADLQTGQVEDSTPLPGLVHGWALTESLDRRSVYVGSGGGHLARFDLAARTLVDLGRATPDATLVFDLATGPDGRIWGASYPGGEVWSFDPAGQSFSAPDPVGGGHEYARSIAVDRDWVYVGTGATRPDIVRISATDPSRREVIDLPEPVTSGFVVTLDLHGRYLAARLPEGRRAVYDTVARTWDVPLALDATGQTIEQTPTTTTVPGSPFYYVTNGRLWRVDPRLAGPGAKRPVALLAAGAARDRTVARTRIGGVLGDWVISYDGLSTVTAVNAGVLPAVTSGPLPQAAVRTFTIRLRPTAVPIKSLAIGSRGEVLVGGFGGSNLSILDPTQADPHLTPLISDPVGRDAFGEVEGMVSNGQYDYFGSYTSARIFRRDATRPWVDGQNPRLLATFGTTLGQDRPIAWTTAGSRTVFGTIPRYGRLGGVLGWFDGAATTPRTVWCPVPEQSVVALASSGSVVFGGTSRWGGLGVQPETSSAEVFAYDLDTGTTQWHVAPLDGAQAFAAVLVDASGRLWAATSTTLFELDPDTGATLRRVPLVPAREADTPTYRTVDLAAVPGRVVVATRGGLFTVDVETLEVGTIASSGVSPPRVRETDGVLYYPSRATLVRATPR
ncbi:hypothetical protein [Terrabacter sp. NPDC000476]|uniref:hypothetical protein n=1 Tax=Terrabacter sp. NPDC000476 TaxID=3154258 RepID=UPI003316F2EA